jgi:hypothetical protein
MKQIKITKKCTYKLDGLMVQRASKVPVSACDAIVKKSQIHKEKEHD